MKPLIDVYSVYPNAQVHHGAFRKVEPCSFVLIIPLLSTSKEKRKRFLLSPTSHGFLCGCVERPQGANCQWVLVHCLPDLFPTIFQKNVCLPFYFFCMLYSSYVLFGSYISHIVCIRPELLHDYNKPYKYSSSVLFTTT